MARPTAYFVQPGTGTTSGDGSVGSPWRRTGGEVVQFALDNITRDATNGDIIHIKDDASDVLGAALDLTTYGTPVGNAPLLFRGYTTAADDGGIGVIDGNNSYSILASTTIDGIGWMDLRLTNTGSNIILQGDNGWWVINCRLDTSSGIAIDLDNNCIVMNNYITGVTGATGIVCGSASLVYGNLISSGVTVAGIIIANSSIAVNNVINLTTTNGAVGINLGNDLAICFNNSVFATAGTGYGIGNATSGRDFFVIFNNIVEGFSGTGGVGYTNNAANNNVFQGFNAAFNNTTNSNFGSADYFFDAGGDDIPLAASPFTNTGSVDFSVGTEVKATGFPNFVGGGITALTEQFMDMGAAQREEPAGGGGGGVKMAGDSGGLVG